MICIPKFRKEHNFIKTVGGGMVLALCTSSEMMMLYICTKFCKKNISIAFKATNLNRRVNTRVVANVDAG